MVLLDRDAEPVIERLVPPDPDQLELGKLADWVLRLPRGVTVGIVGVEQVQPEELILALGVVEGGPGARDGVGGERVEGRPCNVLARPRVGVGPGEVVVEAVEALVGFVGVRVRRKFFKKKSKSEMLGSKNRKFWDPTNSNTDRYRADTGPMRT